MTKVLEERISFLLLKYMVPDFSPVQLFRQEKSARFDDESLAKD